METSAELLSFLITFISVLTGVGVFLFTLFVGAIIIEEDAHV